MKKAFTLAEVLITLGVIGIVAALTLKTLIINYSNNLYSTQLKKAYSEITNAFKLMMATDGVDKLTSTDFFSKFPGETINSNGVPEYLDSELGKYFKILKTCKKNDNVCNPVTYVTLGNSSPITTQKPYSFYTINGQIIYLSELRNNIIKDRIENLKAFNVNCRGSMGTVQVDINGEKGPNKYGRDWFEFVLCENGTLFPYGSKDAALLNAATNNNWQGYHWKYNNIVCSNVATSNGYGCAARVMENNWKIDY